jgi:hypothetical protein
VTEGPPACSPEYEALSCCVQVLCYLTVGTAERLQIDQGIRHQLHAIMPLLYTFNTSTVAAVQGVGINIQGGQIFTGTSTGTAVTLVFSIANANAFTLTGPGGLTSIGLVDFNSGSCTFTVTGPVGGLL